MFGSYAKSISILEHIKQDIPSTNARAQNLLWLCIKEIKSAEQKEIAEYEQHYSESFAAAFDDNDLPY